MPLTNMTPKVPEKLIAALLAFAIMCALVFWVAGRPALARFTEGSFVGFGIGIGAMITVWVLMALVAVAVILVSRVFASRRVSNRPRTSLTPRS